MEEEDGGWELELPPQEATSGEEEREEEGEEMGAGLIGTEGFRGSSGGWRDCSRCLRPSRTCLCPHLPLKPLEVNTSVVVLQHPAEQKRRLQTARLAKHVISGFHLIPSRTVKPHEHLPLLPLGFWDDVEAGRVLVLFPGQRATSLPELVANVRGKAREDGSDPPRLTLLVIDGTWKQAKEMFREMGRSPYLGPRVVQVALPPQEAQERGEGGPPDGVLRKQPMKGCVTTLEAIAFSMFYLESLTGVSGQGQAVREALLRPLRAMVEVQLQHGASRAARTYGESSKLARTLF